MFPLNKLYQKKNQYYSKDCEVSKLLFSPLMLTRRTEMFSNPVFHIKSFLCQSHLYMSFPYSQCLFRRNNLNLDLCHPEKIFHQGDSNGLKQICSKSNNWSPVSCPLSIFIAIRSGVLKFNL